MVSSKPGTPKTKSKPSSTATKKPVGSTRSATAQAGGPSTDKELSTIVTAAMVELAKREIERREHAATRKRVLDELWEVHRCAKYSGDYKTATSALAHISRITGL